MGTEGTDTQKLPIVIEPREWEELTAILRAYVPGRRVWAFGSRATGQRVKRYSDLDLLVDGEDLSMREAAMLEEALVESRLPFKVDVLQMGEIAAEFRERIAGEMVVLIGELS